MIPMIPVCMILVDWQIIDRIRRGYIIVNPYDPELVQPIH